MFTVENAKAYSAKGHAARWQNRPVLTDVAVALAEHDRYLARRIARARRQLDRLDQMMETEADLDKLERVSAAQQRVWTQYRELTGLPSPGQRRPGRERERVPLVEIAARSANQLPVASVTLPPSVSPSNSTTACESDGSGI